MKRINIFFCKYWYVIIPFVLFILLRFPSLFERFWYSDEGIYATIAKALHDGKILYINIWDHKPPLINWIYYIGTFFNYDIGFFLMRLLNLLSGLTAVLILFKILRKFRFKNLVIFATLITFSLLFGSTIIEGNQANSENFFIVFNLLLLYQLITNKFNISSGFLLFLSFMIKPQSFLESSMIFFLFLVINFSKLEKKEFVIKVFRIFLAFFIPFIIYILTLIAQGAFTQFLSTLIGDNIIYADAQGVTDASGFIIDPKFVLIGILVAVVSVSTYLYHKKRISPNKFIVVNLFMMEYFAVCFPGRTYTHYLIQLLPSISLALAFSLAKLTDEIVNNVKYFTMFLLFIAIGYVGFTRLVFPTPHVNPIDYYKTFITDLFTGSQTFELRYRDDIQRELAISNYIETKYADTKSYYLYTYSTWIFALTNKSFTNKYIAAYHLYFGDDKVQEDIKNRDAADLFIYDTWSNKVESFFEGMDKYKKIDEFMGCEFYVRQ